MSRLLLVVLAATAAFAADPPYAGKWKANMAKSDLGETTVTYTDAGSGQMQLMADGLSYTFRADGKDRPALLGQTAAWKQIDASTWQTINKLNGKVIDTDNLKISADGKTFTIETRGTKPNGAPLDETTVFERVSGGPGLAGKWKTKNVKNNSPNVLEFAAAGADGLSIKIPDLNVAVEAKFDGKEYPITGPTVPPNFALTIQKAGPSGFDMTELQNGKALYKVNYSVSPDGKTLTETGGAVATNEKVRVLFDRQ